MWYWRQWDLSVSCFRSLAHFKGGIMAEINVISEEIQKELEGLAEKGLVLLSLSEHTSPPEIVAADRKSVV